MKTVEKGQNSVGLRHSGSSEVYSVWNSTKRLVKQWFTLDHYEMDFSQNRLSDPKGKMGEGIIFSVPRDL